MSGLRSTLRALRAELYRSRAAWLLGKVDGLLNRARLLKERAAKLEAENAAARAGHRPRDGPS